MDPTRSGFPGSPSVKPLDHASRLDVPLAFMGAVASGYNDTFCDAGLGQPLRAHLEMPDDLENLYWEWRDSIRKNPLGQLGLAHIIVASAV